jgi:hypothetical protein
MDCNLQLKLQSQYWSKGNIWLLEGVSRIAEMIISSQICAHSLLSGCLLLDASWYLTLLNVLYALGTHESILIPSNQISTQSLEVD